MLKTALGVVLLGYMSVVCLFFGQYGTFSRSESELTMAEEESALGGQEFSWDKVCCPACNDMVLTRLKVPSLEHLEWQECYDSFQCARLSVCHDPLGTRRFY